MAKAVVGLSGGVDSAVAAYLLKEAGYEVIGVTLRTQTSANRCCEIDDARESAKILGIPYHSFDCSAQFTHKVVEPFIEDYLNARTPNPCVICNRAVKWEYLLYCAKLFEADFVATGHYAEVLRLTNGRYTVKKARYAEKDQTYMLDRLSQEQLSKTLMPLFDKSKDEVRKIAKRIGLPVADKPDSQEICFVAESKYADFIREHAGERQDKPGVFLDESGAVLGKHDGISRYTVGQRKGLGVALGYPAYVKRIDAATGKILLGRGEDLLCKALSVKDINFLSVPSPNAGDEINASVKVRYRHAGENAKIIAQTQDKLRVEFTSPVRFASPGQSAVFYDKDECVLGGGIITNIEFQE